MNRRERKLLEKRFGIKKPKGLNKWAEAVRANIEHGKAKQENMKEVTRLQERNVDDATASSIIASKATELMVSEGLSYIDALEKAKDLYYKKEPTGK